MANWLNSRLNEKITHWVSSGTDEFGNPSGFTRNIIHGRWEDRAVLFIDQNREEVRSESVVFVDSPISVDDYLYEGETTVSDPTTMDDARQIRQVHAMNTLRSGIRYRQAML